MAILIKLNESGHILRKRHFLTAALGAAMLPAFAVRKPSPSWETGPVLLTVTGAIGPGNRGAMDPALDQMMHKQGVDFDRAHVFDFSALTALPSVDISPTLEYDARRHVLRGPLLGDVINLVAGKPLPDTAALKLRAVDGYVIQIALEDVRRYRYIVATHLDGRAIPLGGLGPLWAIYDADRFPDMLTRPLPARFTQCPWALYHIDIVAQDSGGRQTPMR